MSRLIKFLSALMLLALVAAACGGDDDDASSTPTATGTAVANPSPTGTATGDSGDAVSDVAEGTLVVYSGRSEELVGPILERFTEETGIEVAVRYGDTAEMAATILEEGGNSPADVYYGQDAGALGALATEGRLTTLPDEILDEVPVALRSVDGQWVGISGRARVVVYNTDLLDESDLPDSILDFTDPEWDGRIGWAPTNGSFQAFVTALRVLEGDDGARTWLEGIRDNGATEYPNNTTVVEAVAAGEVEVGFVNHYYLYRFLAEDPDYPAANKFYSDGDPGALINVAGAGIVDSSDEPELAERFMSFLLGEEAQTYFATETFEIPLAAGVEPAAELPDVESLTVPDIDLAQLEDLAGTLELLFDLGIV